MKKTISFLTAWCMVCALCLTAFVNVNAMSFPDVPSTHIYHKAINKIADKGIVQGYPDGMYKPSKVINRAELLKIIVKANYSDAEIAVHKGEVCFNDVPANEWYTEYVCFGKEKGIVEGYPGTNEFRPNNPIIFVEALKIAMVAFEYGYPHDPQVWYKSIVDSATNAYSVEGGERNFVPLEVERFDEEFTRGKMAEMIARMVSHQENGKKGLADYLGDDRILILPYTAIQERTGVKVIEYDPEAKEDKKKDDTKEKAEWQPVSNEMWQDKDGNWLMLRGETETQTPVLMWSSDEGKTWSEVPEWTWQGEDGKWYMFDEDWRLLWSTDGITWEVVPTETWPGKAGKWYTLDEEGHLWWKQGSVASEWNEDADGMWQDVDGKWLKIEGDKLWWSADGGETWAEVPGWMWEGTEGTWYKFDEDWMVWMSTDGETWVEAEGQMWEGKNGKWYMLDEEGGLWWKQGEKQMIKVSACVEAGMSLGPLAVGNEAACCADLEEVKDVSQPTMRGTCELPKIDIGTGLGAKDVNTKEFPAACVAAGDNLGPQVEGNNAQCCAGLDATSVTAESRGMCTAQ